MLRECRRQRSSFPRALAERGSRVLSCAASRPGSMPLSFFLAALLAAPAVRAAAPADLAPALASELASALRGLRVSARRLAIAPLAGTAASRVRDELRAALTRALAAQPGLEIVDAAAARAALAEASLGAGAADSKVAELGGALGADATVVGSLDAMGGDWIANVRVLASMSGSLLASAKASTAGAGTAREPADASAARTTTGAPYSLDAEIRRLGDKLAAGIERATADARYQHVAVLPLDSVGPRAIEQQLGLLIAAELSTFLQRDHGLLLVERTRLASILDELALGQTGLVDPAKAAEVGKLAGAQSLVVGSVSEAGDRYLVDTRVVSSSDGRILLAENASLPAADLVALSSEAVVLRTRSGAIYRSLLLPGWGQFYNREPTKALVFVATELTAAGFAVAYQVLAGRAQRDYDRMHDGDFDSAFALAKDRRTWRNNFLWLTLAVHLVNVADAAISGRSFDSGVPSGSSALGFCF
jgi:TolB-like protein